MAITLIVMEPGSEWPGHVRDVEDVVALADGGEGLLAPIEHRLDALRRRGEHVRVALLACNGAVDPMAVQRRSEVAAELLAAVTSVVRGHLVLSVGDNVSMAVRRELLSLAGALSQKIEGTTATVSIKFGVAVASGYHYSRSFPPSPAQPDQLPPGVSCHA